VLGLCAVAALATGATAVAQTTFGSGALVARVQDSQGRPLAGALVTVDGRVSRQATTNLAGLATLVGLPAGKYDVSVSLAGYAQYDTSVAVTSVTSAPKVVATELAPASFAGLGSGSAVTALPQLGANIDPFVAHPLTDEAFTNVVAGAGGAGVSLDGTAPNESRVELDGIPLAGGAASPATVRFRDLIGLSGIEVAEGPFVRSPSLRNAVGGIVDLRTPSLDGPQVAGIDNGYDSAFGSFQHVRVRHDFGSLALGFDAVTGGGEDRSQSLKARYGFAPGDIADLAFYGLQASGPIGTDLVTTSAPAYSAGVSLAAGGGTFEARAFGSSLAVSSSISTPLVPNENASARGLETNYDLPLGTNRLQASFDRRSESATFAGEPAVHQTFTTLDILGSFALAHALGLDVGDAYSGGTLVPARNDPRIALSYRPGTVLSFGLEAGSGFATAPDELLASRSAASLPLPPETSFGYRATANAKIDGLDRIWLIAYAQRRFETFGSLADAQNRGAGIGFERAPAKGFGTDAYVALERSYASGPAQPARDAAAFSGDAGAQLADDPFAKERLAFTYAASPTCVSRVGATFLGANNAFSTHAVTLGGVSLCAPLFGVLDVRVGEANVFGASVSDPFLAPLYVPHEFTFGLGIR
jgi:hypothetical protein